MAPNDVVMNVRRALLLGSERQALALHQAHQGGVVTLHSALQFRSLPTECADKVSLRQRRGEQRSVLLTLFLWIWLRLREGKGICLRLFTTTKPETR
jgi:hypothetical protein